MIALTSRFNKNPPLALFLFGALLFFVNSLHAQEHRGRERERGRVDEYRSPHWHYDDRYRHGHYYPALGYSVGVLPPGYLSITYGGGRFFFHGGVFFRAAGPGYVVVRPPIGVVVPALPPAYATVVVSGAPYYYANDTYYSPIPGGAGYAVVAPPSGAESTTGIPASPPAAGSPPAGQAPSSAAQPPAGVWYYCESSKTYYPYAQECREGWRQVPATPPAPGR
jgi:hypothetical protein